MSGSTANRRRARESLLESFPNRCPRLEQVRSWCNVRRTRHTELNLHARVPYPKILLEQLYLILGQLDNPSLQPRADWPLSMAQSNEDSNGATQPVSVLFVCLGNICRSPMAEGVFRALANQHPLISTIDSCGTGAYHTGSQPDPRTLAVLKSNSITKYKHKARKVRVPQDFLDFDYILAMDEDNLGDLRDMEKRARKKGLLKENQGGKICLYGEFGGRVKGEEVGDPYYGGDEGFAIAFEQVERFGKGLMKHIEEGSTQIPP